METPQRKDLDVELHASLVRLQPKIMAVTGRRRAVIGDDRESGPADGALWLSPVPATDVIGDDHFQTVYATCWERRDRYRGRWTDRLIVTIARNKWKEQQRRISAARRREAALEVTEQLRRDAKRVSCASRGRETTTLDSPIGHSDAEEAAVRREQCSQLRRALRGLRKEYRWVLRKRFIERQSDRQIATESGCELETVRTWFKRAKAELRRDPMLRQLVGL